MNYFEPFKLDYVLTEEYFTKTIGEKIINQFNNLEDLIKGLRNLLKEYQGMPMVFSHAQLYGRIIPFPNGNYYTIVWDTQIAKLIIKDEKIPVQKLSVNYLNEFVDKSTLDKKHLKKSLGNNKSIIVIDYPILNSYYIIDGNHRVHSRFRAGIEGVNGHILQPSQHFWAIVSPLFQVCFLIQQAINSVVDYIHGDISEDELERMLNSTKNPLKVNQITFLNEKISHDCVF